MQHLLEMHKQLKPWIDLFQDCAFIIGVIPVIISIFKFMKFMTAKERLAAAEKIELNLRFRERIEPKLESYILQKHRNERKDIGIRFIYWKNYPSKISNDAYNHLLRIEYHNRDIIARSWINNTGIYFQEHLWFTSTSAYIDSAGIFFFAPSCGNYTGFVEHKNMCLVIHLPFSNIVNFDFEEIIEYEAIFYTKVPYNDFKKLYSRLYALRERIGCQYFRLELDRRKQMKRYSWLRYVTMQATCQLRQLMGAAF